MIQINNKYFIKAEEDQFTLCEKYINKNEEVCYKALTYHPSFTSALEKVMRLEQVKKLNEKDVTLFEALEILKNINEDFRKTLKTYIEVYEWL
nr:MAG TPA: protein of unknown function DUF5405 [Caudoviricetes sp.]